MVVLYVLLKLTFVLDSHLTKAALNVVYWMLFRHVEVEEFVRGE